MCRHGGHCPHAPLLGRSGIVGSLSQAVEIPHGHRVPPATDRVQGNANQLGAGINGVIESVFRNLRFHNVAPSWLLTTYKEQEWKIDS